MEISNTKTQQIITLFIILVIQLCPIVLTSTDVLQETKTSIRHPISRQHSHKVVTTTTTTYKHEANQPPQQHSSSSTQSWSVSTNARSSHSSTHSWTVPVNSGQPDQTKSISNSNLDEQVKQLQNMIQNSNPNEQPNQVQNSIPKPNPTEQPKQPQNPTLKPNPTVQPKQPPNTVSNPSPPEQPKQPQNPNPSPSPTEQPKPPQNPNPSPSPTEQPKPPQNLNPSPSPPQHPKNQIPTPDPPQQPQSPPPNPSKKPDTHIHKKPFHMLNPFKNHNPNEPGLPPKCSQSEVDQILKVHNQARVHESEPLYVWDEDLAEFARHYAKKRIHDCKAIHSYGPYGENLFWGLYDHWTIPKAVQSWINEEKDYDKRRHVCQPGKLCGHYTQIVWRDSIKVGCARLKCAHGLGFFITCNYDPPGNYPNENPFEPHNKD